MAAPRDHITTQQPLPPAPGGATLLSVGLSRHATPQPKHASFERPTPNPAHFLLHRAAAAPAHTRRRRVAKRGLQPPRHVLQQVDHVVELGARFKVRLPAVRHKLLQILGDLRVRVSLRLHHGRRTMDMSH